MANRAFCEVIGGIDDEEHEFERLVAAGDRAFDEAWAAVELHGVDAIEEAARESVRILSVARRMGMGTKPTRPADGLSAEPAINDDGDPRKDTDHVDRFCRALAGGEPSSAERGAGVRLLLDLMIDSHHALGEPETSPRGRRLLRRVIGEVLDAGLLRHGDAVFATECAGEYVIVRRRVRQPGFSPMALRGWLLAESDRSLLVAVPRGLDGVELLTVDRATYDAETPS